MSRRRWFLYVLRCVDETLYTGVTTDLARRLGEHNSGQGARYTAGRRPVRLVGAWSFQGQSAAQRAEAQFRRLSRRVKLQHIARKMPFAGSAFCRDEIAEELLAPIRLCTRCGELLKTVEQPKDGQPLHICAVCEGAD